MNRKALQEDQTADKAYIHAYKFHGAQMTKKNTKQNTTPETTRRADLNLDSRYGAIGISAVVAADDLVLGRGADGLWICALGIAARDRPNGRVISIGKFAGIIFAGDNRPPGELDRRNHGNVLRAGSYHQRVEILECRLHLVRFNRSLRDIFGRGTGEPARW